MAEPAPLLEESESVPPTKRDQVDEVDDKSQEALLQLRGVKLSPSTEPLSARFRDHSTSDWPEPMVREHLAQTFDLV